MIVHRVDLYIICFLPTGKRIGFDVGETGRRFVMVLQLGRLGTQMMETRKTCDRLHHFPSPPPIRPPSPPSCRRSPEKPPPPTGTTTMIAAAIPNGSKNVKSYLRDDTAKNVSIVTHRIECRSIIIIRINGGR